MTYEDVLATIQALIAKMDGNPTNSLKYEILGDMAKIVDAGIADGAAPIDALECNLYLGSGYFALGHYTLSLEYYGKAMTALEKCRGSYAEDEDLVEWLEEGFINMRDMYSRMGEPDEADKLAAFVKDIAPDSYAAFTSARRIDHIKRDPIEYTERYMAILPELEAKLDAELEGESRGMGFCFHLWHKKAEILKRDYGIEWESPGLLNPTVRFD